jgi:flagellar motor switch protein FliM
MEPTGHWPIVEITDQLWLIAADYAITDAQKYRALREAIERLRTLEMIEHRVARHA